VALAVLVFVRHHANIRRLLAGTESKIGAEK
jgi:glycerol-3-phosphate acyltransferase PlsY